jgi:hypothetical protein
VLECVTQRLNVLLVVLGHGDVRLGAVSLCRDTVCAVARRGVPGHATVDNTLARQTRDVGDPGEGSAVLADPREGRQGEDASTT